MANASMGTLEQAVMTVLWEADHPGLTVREVLDRMEGRELAYTTVMTVLTRLETKGIATRERDGRAWRYQAKESREALTAQAMRSPLDELTREERQSAILHFLSGASPAEIDAVREAMAAVEAKDASRPRRGRRSGR